MDVAGRVSTARADLRRSTTEEVTAVSELELRRAECLLFDIASALRRVPFTRETKDLHVRSLTLKSRLEQCRRGTVHVSTVLGLLDALVALDRSVAAQARARANALSSTRAA